MLFLLLGLVLLPLLSLPLNLPLRLEIPGPRLAAWVHTCCSFVCMIETHLQDKKEKRLRMRMRMRMRMGKRNTKMMNAASQTNYLRQEKKTVQNTAHNLLQHKNVLYMSFHVKYTATIGTNTWLCLCNNDILTRLYSTVSTPYSTETILIFLFFSMDLLVAMSFSIATIACTSNVGREEAFAQHVTHFGVGSGLFNMQSSAKV